MYDAQTAPAETYAGETYVLQKRTIMTFGGPHGYIRVWCWEVTSGPAAGIFGGKQATKADARRAARDTIKAWAA